MEKYQALFDEMRGGIGISSMVNVTSGKFCGDYGRGSAMVQIGGYGADGYKGDKRAIVEFLKPEIQQAKRSRARVANGLPACSCRIIYRHHWLRRRRVVSTLQRSNRHAH